ncbi:alpha/beta hydrolase [Nocardioides sp. CCNWLW239]|uniref:alpha/beta fold hydrolase n=1 Tax=Nocardioides sp. CCNWLW239 TaxID=3128902 RepID=UPI003018708E
MTASPLRRAYADTVLGQLHYAEMGSGDPLILLHQTPRSHEEFYELQPLLAQRRRVIAMDMYGFGLSAKPPSPQCIEDYARGVLALADALELTSYAVLGHHTGMFVASEVAASDPGRVSAVVLSSGKFVDAEFRATTQPPGPDDVDVAPIRDDGGHLQTLWDKRRQLYPAGRPELLDAFVRDALAPGVDPAEGHRAVKRYRMENRVGLVTAPVLVIGATDDPVAYPHTDRVVQAYRNAARVERHDVLGGGIPLMEERPGEVADVVGAFLDRLGH